MKITIITTVLNQANALSLTMQSVFEKTRPNIDYIVIDGGSVDGTIEIIRAQADCLKHWLSEPDAGVYDAMNKGWALADPDSWVLFLGAGDKLLTLPNENNGSEDPYKVFYGNVILDGGRVFRARAGFLLKLYNSLHHQALLIPKRLHPEPPFDVIYRLYADFDFNQKLYKNKVRFQFEPALQSYAASGGLTEYLQLQELTQIIRKNFGLLWWGLSLAGFSLAKCFPFLRRFRPIKMV